MTRIPLFEVMSNALELYEFDQSAENHGALMQAVHNYVEDKEKPDDGYCQACDDEMCTAKKGCVALDNPQPKQEQGEPVAYIHRNEYNEYRLEPHDDFDIKSIPFNVDVPLFKSPPQRQRTWVGLTEEEVIDLWPDLIMHRHTYQFWQNLEAKLKEKNT